MQLKCIASTGIDERGTELRQQQQHQDQPKPSSASTHSSSNASIFQSVEFSADSSTLVAYTEDQCLRTFLLPADLLQDDSREHCLSESSIIPSPSRIQSYCLYPGFDQFDSSTTFVLQGSADVPIALRNVFHHDFPGAKYNLIHPTTEAYLKASSLQFTSDGQHFLAGSNNVLAVFDATRTGSAPILKHGKKSSNSIRSSLQTRLACSGIISTLDCSNEGILATGSFRRTIGLYSNQGLGECISAFSLQHLDAEHPRCGSGITKVVWSPDGRYLLVAERQSDVVHIFDIRNTGQRVGWLSGRQADTTQKLGVDLVPTLYGFEAWAGGTDGIVRVWNDPGSRDGEHGPDQEFRCHDDAVAGAVWDRSGTVLATCSGSREGPRRFTTDSQECSTTSDSDNEKDFGADGPPDCSLRVWTPRPVED